MAKSLEILHQIDPVLRHFYYVLLTMLYQQWQDRTRSMTLANCDLHVHAALD